MITEIVTFDIPRGMTRQNVFDLFEQSAEIWRAYPKLHRKNYLYDGEAGIAGGVYTWDSLSDAQEAHGDAFVTRVRDSFGGEPRFQYFETPVIVDNRCQTP